MSAPASAAAPTPPQGTLFSFSGAGWLLTYHLGVADAVRDTIGFRAPPPLPPPTPAGGDGDAAAEYTPLATTAGYDTFVGSSGGGIAAVLTALDVPRGDVAAMCDTLHGRYRADLRTAFRLRRCLVDGFTHLQPRIDACCPDWQRAAARLSAVYVMGIWPQPLHLSALNTFQSPADLLEAIVATSCIPPFAGFYVKLRRSQRVVFDGGLHPAGFIPRAHDANAVAVAPFWWATDAHIRPSYLPTTWALFPPRDPRAYRDVYRAGYNDALGFLAARGDVSKERCEALRQPLETALPTAGEGALKGTVVAASGVSAARFARRRAHGAVRSLAAGVGGVLLASAGLFAARSQ